MFFGERPASAAGAVCTSRLNAASRANCRKRSRHEDGLLSARHRGGGEMNQAVADFPGRAAGGTRRGALVNVSRSCGALQSAWRDQTRAASAAACGAAAEVPAKGRAAPTTREGHRRHEVRFGPAPLGTAGSCTPGAGRPHPTAPTARTSGPSPGEGMLPGKWRERRPPPSTTRWKPPAVPRSRRTRTRLLVGRTPA